MRGQRQDSSRPPRAAPHGHSRGSCRKIPTASQRAEKKTGRIDDHPTATRLSGLMPQGERSPPLGFAWPVSRRFSPVHLEEEETQQTRGGKT
jgi:hypothetical protein